MDKVICFDMDGTIADFYAIPGWLECIHLEETYPYRQAEQLLPVDLLYKLKAIGYKLTIISWNAKGASKDYSKAVRRAKLQWIETHYPNLFDEVHIVKYGTRKQYTIHEKNAILVDDNEQVRDKWTKGTTIDASDTELLIEKLIEFIQEVEE